MKQRQRRVVLFYSYDPADAILRDKLARFLRPLVREAHVEEWSDQQILAGADFVQERKCALESATHILLLLSADYLASEVCHQEMLSALERQKSGGVRVVPILLRPCLLPKTLGESLSCLPDNGQPVSMWKKRDEAFFDVAQDICRILRLPLVSLRRRSTDRDRLLDRIFTYWIEGLLEPSLEGGARLDLSLQEQPDALDNPGGFVNPWRDEVQELHRVLRPLSAGMSIIQVYDEANGELLILGEPGAGKTTLLLELTRTLLARAEKDERAGMPVVFHLSSWAKRKQTPLGTWLVEELATKYRMPRKVCQSWIEANHVIPLLDGLDEVDEKAQADCIRAIANYHHQEDQIGTPLVICCRLKEYQALSIPLPLARAVNILPLTKRQIDEYLSHAQGQDGLEGLRQELDTDKDLAELACRPLMLNIFTLAYQGAVPADLPTGATQEQILQAVFAHYVERMLSRRARLPSWMQAQFLRWLAFVARQLYRHHQTVLVLEDLRPDWLPHGYQRLYQWSTRLVFGLPVGLLVGLPFALFLKPPIALPVVLAVVLTVVLADGGWALRKNTIQLAEVITWSWEGAGCGLVVGLLLALVLMLVVGLGGRLVFGLVLEPGYLLGTALFFVLCGGLVFGLSEKQLTERTHLSPNEGTWRSLKNGMLIGLPIGLVIALGGGGIGIAVGSGLGVALLFGLNAFIQHFILRAFLWGANRLPWNLIAFLDEAATRLLLRKVGGSYIFVHRLLLEYFATLETSASPTNTASEGREEKKE